MEDLNKNVSEEVTVLDTLIAEGNKRLKIVLEIRNLTEAKGAQNLITAGITANKELKVKKDKADSLSSVINKRKNNLITNFISKTLTKK